MKSLSWILAFCAAILLTITGCPQQQQNTQVKSASGVTIAHVDVKPDADGLTAEQRNVRDRLLMDNSVGSIKHLYVISPYSGQVLIYSTVRVKVTSSGKRLSPRTVLATDGNYVDADSRGIQVNIGGRWHRTSEVLEDDGTYGDSVPYIFWWDTKKIYHQHFFTGGQIIHVSDQPVAAKSVVLNLEVTPTQQDGNK